MYNIVINVSHLEAVQKEDINCLHSQPLAALEGMLHDVTGPVLWVWALSMNLRRNQRLKMGVGQQKSKRLFVCAVDVSRVEDADAQADA